MNCEIFDKGVIILQMFAHAVRYSGSRHPNQFNQRVHLTFIAIISNLDSFDIAIFVLECLLLCRQKKERANFPYSFAAFHCTSNLVRWVLHLIAFLFIENRLMHKSAAGNCRCLLLLHMQMHALIHSKLHSIFSVKLVFNAHITHSPDICIN